MTEKPDHLTDDAGAALAESVDERIYFIRSKRWIAYPKAIEILGHLNALLKHPRTMRMPSLAVYGDSGMGKSMLVEKFKDDYALSAPEKPRGPKAKLLVVELAGRPNERRLFAQIRAVLGAPQNPRALLAGVARAITNPATLDAVRDETILRGRRSFERLCEEAQLGSSTWEREPSNVRIFLVDILTFDGFFGAKFDILKPRWLPTNMLGTVLSRIW